SVPGIGKVRATAIKKAWDDQRALREIHIFLQTYGVTTSQCVKLINRYGPEAMQLIQREPYRIARDIDGIGFKTADRIAINLGFANDAPPRLDAGLLFVMETLQEEGHTAIREADLRDHAAALLETSPDLAAGRIAALIEKKDLVAHPAQPLFGHGHGEESQIPSLKSQIPNPKSQKNSNNQISNPNPPSQPAPQSSPPPAGTAASLSPAPSVMAAPTPAPLASASANPQSALRIPHSPLPGSALLQLPFLDRAEQKIAATIARLARVASGLPPIKREAAVRWAEQKAGITFAARQRAALLAALASKVSILTGGPGTGKTASLRALVDILKAKRVRVHLAAPTGRAAQRLAESTGGFASTIHRLLKYDPAKGGFSANADTPLATDFLIVDEASMLDTRLAASLFQAIPSRAHLLLVGDTDQLPSVGPGNVLKDIIAVAGAAGGGEVTSDKYQVSGCKNSAAPATPRPTPHSAFRIPHSALPPGPPAARAPGPGGPSASLQAIASGDAISALPRSFRIPHSTFRIPVTRLDIIHRQKSQSQIVTTAHAINNGDATLPPATPELASIQVWGDLTCVIADSADDCLRKTIALCTEFIPRHFHYFNPVRDVQVLAPMHKGAAGVANLNLQLQAALNPRARAQRTLSGDYRPGDKVIQLRNNYDKNLFNGDIGAILAADAQTGALTIDFDGQKHDFQRGETGDLALAYAISIHKSQGSEYPVVIIPLLKAHFMMLQRNLLYTAITRGKKKVFIVGEPAAYGMSVRNAESKHRTTHLREKITALFADPC
ncbi:MAG: AAA family ATPase, partial [Opitutaceae bacterium]|nr:AAA family ATPase [Opitutaceae bacterium]